ncbi:hypothetical protein KXV32_000701 [Aspergillus fumigatus]|nr:hypothetical protein KXV32_000701 [Aspergillus fumigatus]
MALYDRITSMRDHHSRILADLKTVEHAPDTLKSHEAYLSDLRKQLAQISDRLKKVAELTQIEREEHTKYRDSTIRRLMYRASGRGDEFEKKADKEMREYYNALEKERAIKAEKEMLETQIEEATAAREELQAACTERLRLHEELKSLYENLFGGPTAEFPEEDALEEATKAAQAWYGELSGRLNNIYQAAQCLAKAQITVKQALLDMYEALQHCQRDIWGFGSIVADFGRQNCLSRAQSRARQTQVLVSQAMRLDPDVQPLPRMTIAQESMISRILFDNIFVDLNCLAMVQQSFNEMKNVEVFLRTQLTQAKSREANIRTQLESAAVDLENSQRELQRTREQIFMNVVDPPLRRPDRWNTPCRLIAEERRVSIWARRRRHCLDFQTLPNTRGVTRAA